jgi:hypothetical protein
MGHHNKESLGERVVHAIEHSGAAIQSIPLETGDQPLVQDMVDRWGNKVVQDGYGNLYVDQDIEGHHPAIVATSESLTIFADTHDQADTIAHTVADNVKRH